MNKQQPKGWICFTEITAVTADSLNILATMISPQNLLVNSADVMNITLECGKWFLIDRFTSAGVQTCLDNTQKN